MNILDMFRKREKEVVEVKASNELDPLFDRLRITTRDGKIEWSREDNGDLVSSLATVRFEIPSFYFPEIGRMDNFKIIDKHDDGGYQIYDYGRQDKSDSFVGLISEIEKVIKDEAKKIKDDKLKEVMSMLER